jgi:hypothetical protein
MSSSNITADLYEYIEEYIETELIPLAIHVSSRLSGMRTKANTAVTSSSGASVTIIPADIDSVYQAYLSHDIFKKISKFYEVLNTTSDPRRKYIVTGKPVDTGIFEFAKVYPLNEFGPYLNASIIQQNYRQIKHDITEAIDFVHSLQIRHGDTRVDNIGYSKELGCFVLFDFDKISLHLTSAGIEDDKEIFKESLNRFR